MVCENCLCRYQIYGVCMTATYHCIFNYFQGVTDGIALCCEKLFGNVVGRLSYFPYCCFGGRETHARHMLWQIVSLDWSVEQCENVPPPVLPTPAQTSAKPEGWVTVNLRDVCLRLPDRQLVHTICTYLSLHRRLSQLLRQLGPVTPWSCQRMFFFGRNFFDIFLLYRKQFLRIHLSAYCHRINR